MGSACQQLVCWNSTSHGMSERLSCNLLRGLSFCAPSSLARGYKDLAGVHWRPSLVPVRSKDKPGSKRHGVVNLRCCDASAAEISDSPLEVIEPSIDSDRPSTSSRSSIPAVSFPFEQEALVKAEKEILNTLVYPEPLVVEEETAKPALEKGSEDLLSCKESSTFPSEQSSVSDESLQLDGEKGLLQQMWDIALFAGPALGIWLSGPMMSLIDTAVVGNSSSLELAALGPGTVFCDQLCYVFMFLSVATSNLIASSLAKQDEAAAAHHLSRLLFVALASGIGMLLFTGMCSSFLLKAFVGPQNLGLVPAALSYVQIRGLAWPAVLVGMVAQSASLGMRDSWGPLKVLAIASSVNLCGDIFLCTFLGYGIAGAAWATMLSQYIGGYLMLKALSRKGYNALDLRIPSTQELVNMIEIAAPVLLTMLSKVSFYAFITFLSTSLGAVTLAAHQVMIGIYSTCTVSGEPLCQTAQSFMPALIQGKNQDLKKARTLLRSLVLIGVMCGIFLGCFAICFPWIFPQVFTSDVAVIAQMRAVTLPFLCGLLITPPLLSLEGTLLAGRDLKFLSLSMMSCFACGATVLMGVKRMGLGLPGFWWTLAGFQTARFVMSYFRLSSSKSVLRKSRPQPTKLA